MFEPLDEQGMGIKLVEIGNRILVSARNELYIHMRFLDVALSSFRYELHTEISCIATDGYAIYYHPQYLGGLYREQRILVNRAYLHMVLHCLFRHLLKRKGREVLHWNLACDIVIESIIDGMNHRSVKQARSWLRTETYRKLQEHMNVLTAEKVYAVLERWELSERDLIRLIREYTVDDHRFWPEEEDRKKQSELEQTWQDISEQMETDMETFSKEAASKSGDLLEQMRVEHRDRHDYRQFLRKFSVLKEEIQIDPDSFDYVFYSYGLHLYGNMPLIEPQEWSEVQKIEEFVIVIDTSMSCSGELVKRFLEETYSVLSEQSSFFRRINIHIIQCDDQIQMDQTITSAKELKAYMEHLELRGEGGTDFRPAFEYVEMLMANHSFTRLKGLLYFTDGQGIYPRKMPPYDTVFVFMKEDYEDVDVPPWAMKMILEESDLDYDTKGEAQWI